MQTLQKMVNVLLLIPNLGNGGAQSVFRSHLDHLGKFANVTGCLFNWDGSLPTDHEKGIISLDVPAGSTFLSKIYFFLKRIEKVKKIKRERKIQITISHLEGADYINVLSKTSDRTICWIHGTKQHDLAINGIIGWVRIHLLIPLLYKKADKIITVCKELGIEMDVNIKGISKKIKTIYNGFDVEKIIAFSKEELSPSQQELFNQRTILIAHCRLAPQKNLRALLHVFAEIRKKDKSAILVLIGDGELRSDLSKLCFQLNLRPSHASEFNSLTSHHQIDVAFLGYQSNPFKFLSKASAFLMTSSWEGFPLALCEAMACGNFVFCADCHTGPREIMVPEIELDSPRLAKPHRNKYGYLMPLVSEEDNSTIITWANVIVEEIALGCPGNHKREDSINRIKEFDYSHFVNASIEIIRE